MSSTPSWRLIPLWLRLKRLLRTIVTTKPRLSHLNQFFAIINDWISLTRKPKTTPSESGPEPSAPPADDTNDSKYQLF